MLLNSHGHGDHVGNNDVIAEIPASETSHYISAKSDPYFDPFDFFRDAYNEGARYFDYLEGLDVTVDGLMPLLARAGLDPNVDGTTKPVTDAVDNTLQGLTGKDLGGTIQGLIGGPPRSLPTGG